MIDFLSYIRLLYLGFVFDAILFYMYIALIVIFQYSAMVWFCFLQLLICPAKTTRSLCKFHPEADTCIRSGLQVSKKHMLLPLSLVEIKYCGRDMWARGTALSHGPYRDQISNPVSCVINLRRFSWPRLTYICTTWSRAPFIYLTCEDRNLKSHYTHSDVITSTRRSPNTVFYPTMGQHYL